MPLPSRAAHDKTDRSLAVTLIDMAKTKTKPPPMLTPKQRKFVEAYVQTGKGVKAARIAGYSGDDRTLAALASKNTRKDSIAKAIAQASQKPDITPDRVMSRLAHLSIAAEEAQQFGVSARCEELLGKGLGLWIERRENVNLNVGDELLRALLDRARAKREQGQVIEHQPADDDDDDTKC